jgi:hypothetical protein
VTITSVELKSRFEMRKKRAGKSEACIAFEAPLVFRPDACEIKTVENADQLQESVARLYSDSNVFLLVEFADERRVIRSEREG